MARVGIDLDGVCYDFVGALRGYLRDYDDWAARSMPEATRWEFYEDWGMDREQFMEYSRAGVRSGQVFWWGTPLPGTYSALRELRKAGHHIIIVTDRASISEEAVPATKAWLGRLDLPYDELHFAADKTQFDLDYMIDDRLENYDALDAAGVKVYLWDRPWNQDDTKERRRISSWTQFLRAVGLTDAEIGTPTMQPPPEDMSAAERLVREAYMADPKTNGVRMDYGMSVAPMLDPYKVDEVRVTSSTGGQKGQKLARFDLIPWKALWKVAELYGKGAEKYADNNWRQGYDWSLSFAAMQRHASLFWSGEDIDPETKCPHMASVAFHALSLLTFMEEHPEFDTRFKAGE